MVLYKKVIDGKAVIKSRNKIVIKKNGRQYINPLPEMLAEDGWEVYEPTQQEESEEKPQHRAEQARADLADSDYKVIKCMEAYLCGEPLPYDIAELHKERDAQRLTINKFEEGL